MATTLPLLIRHEGKAVGHNVFNRATFKREMDSNPVPQIRTILHLPPFLRHTKPAGWCNHSQLSQIQCAQIRAHAMTGIALSQLFSKQTSRRAG